MGRDTPRDEGPDDLLDDGLDDLTAPEDPPRRELLDDDLLDELDDLALEQIDPTQTFDEFVVDLSELGDSGGTEWHEEDLATPEPPSGDELPALPWSMRARLPELGVELAAILDPTRAESEWIVRDAPERPAVATLVEVGPVAARITLRIRQGPVDELHLGRDLLGGRAVVRS